MPLQWPAFFLTTAADIDTNEGSFATENENSLLGTYGGPGNGLSKNIATFNINDANGNGIWDRDNVGSVETSTVTTNGVTENVTLDSILAYNATVTFLDGTTGAFSAVVIQLSDGRVYLAPEFSDNADNALLESGIVQSISLDSVIVDSANLFADRVSANYLVCFDGNVRIAVEDGEKRAADLKVGELVQTRDRGLQEIRWIGKRTVPATSAMAPIEFAENAIGTHRPFRVSPQHRVALSGWRAEMLFGEWEVLAPAISLVNGETIRQVEGGEVEYVHFLFDHHEIVFAEGAPCESLLLGKGSVRALPAKARLEILALFPELNTLVSASHASRRLLSAREGETLARFSDPHL